VGKFKAACKRNRHTVKKTVKTPLALRVIPAVFPWLERLAPFLANRFFRYLFFTPISYPIPDKERKAEKFSENFVLSVGDMKIQCYRWGESKKTILVVHGWAGRATQFRRFVKPVLAEGYQVVGFDGPAHGKSSGWSTNLNEFLQVIQELRKQFDIQAIIAHSFGGVASLYAIAEGLPVKTLVTIASPTIADEIVNTYLRAIGASAKTGEAFKKYILGKYGKPFEAYSSLAFIRQVPENLELLLAYDTDDIEVSMKHPQELMKVFPKARLLQTSGLGHTRILRDNSLIREVVTFIRLHSSES
jgi:pimeloyl-ACP methyl ester carboxylesterase